MTKSEKQRKLKIISLIIICNFVKAQKQPPVTNEDHINNIVEFQKWIFEMEKITAPTPRHGSSQSKRTNNAKIN